MLRLRSTSSIGCFCLALFALASVSDAAQRGPTAPSAQSTVEGTVISTTTGTLLVRSDGGDFHLFSLDSRTTRPATIPVGARVSVASAPPVDGAVPAADVVRIVSLPASAPATAKPTDEPVPATIRQLERDIQRQVNRYRVGVRAGLSLDPELVMIGAHAQIGPFFNENFSARPGIELGFGELSTLIALNFDGAYRLPVSPSRGRWRMFMGGGPSLTFVSQGFEGEDDDVGRFDFNNFDLDVGLNIFLGIESRSGFFMELRSKAYAVPSVAFQVGYNF